MRLNNLKIPKSIILPSLGSHIDTFKPNDQRVTARIPTSVAIPGRGLDLDYTALLVVEQLLVDKGIYSHLQYSDYSCHKPLFNTLRVLRNEGMVELIDFSKMVSTHSSHLREKMNARALEDAGTYRPVLQETIRRWRDAQRTLKLALGKEYTEHVAIPIGVAHHLAQEGNTISTAKSQAIEKLIFSRRQRLSREELQILRSVATPYISYVHENMILRDELSVPFIDWHDLEPFYNKAILTPPREERRLTERALQNARLLYEQRELDLVRPATVEDLLVLLGHKHINKVRERFLRSALNNETTDRAWFEKQKTAAMQIRNKEKKRKWSMVLVDVSLDVLKDALHLSNFVDVAKKAATMAYEEAPEKDFEWIYVIMKEEEQSTKTLDL